MRFSKRVYGILLSSLLMLSFTACGEREIAEFNIPKQLDVALSATVAESEKHELVWDDENFCVLLRNKDTGYVWSTTPYQAYREGETSSALNSNLSIEYYDLSDSSTQFDRSYTCVSDGQAAAEITKNSIRVEYYFSVAEVMVPVTFSLKNDALHIEVKAKEIIESGKTILTAISFAPYLCSTKNAEDKSAYLFVPTGSGALMYADTDVSGAGRQYSGEVYGTDASRIQLDVVGNEEAVTAPVFGVKTSDNNALMGIIEDGAESARIDAVAGNQRYGYSNVYASFLVRGYDEIEQIVGSWRADANAYAEKWSSTAVYSVSYYPLTNENASYSGMARNYKKYLLDKKLLSKSGAEQENYQIEFIGGLQVKKFVLGIPYYKVEALTSFDDALELTENIIKDTSVTPIIVLSGYGESGIDIGGIAGGYDFAGSLGGKKALKEIEKYCKEKDIPLFTNFNLTQYTKSGDGFSTMFDVAKSANLQAAAIEPLTVNTRTPDSNGKKVRLLKRGLIPKAMDKLLRFADDDITGLALSNFGALAYSDYTEESTFMKDGTEEQISELIAKAQKAGHNILLQGANSYAAGIADSVSYVPLDNGGYNAFDISVPFYQMVFSGYTPLYSTPVNFSSDVNDFVLDCVEFGTSPSFTISKNHNSRLHESAAQYLYTTEYSGNKDVINKVVESTRDYYNAVKGASIVNHTIIENGLTKTVYNNGITVFVNHNQTDMQVDGISVAANAFRFVKANG